VVATLRQINRSVVQPVVIAPAIGLVEEGLTWVSHGGRRPQPATRRQLAEAEGGETEPGG
jgi:hypothetical protein